MTMCDYEIRVLRDISGDIQDDLRWGAAMSVAIEALVGYGYVRGGRITEAGRAALSEVADRAGDANVSI